VEGKKKPKSTKHEKILPSPGTQQREEKIGGLPKERADLPLVSKRRKKDELLDKCIQRGLTTHGFVPIPGNRLSYK
jgi:hypothetical protein